MGKQQSIYWFVVAVVSIGTVAHGYVTGRWTASSAANYSLPNVPTTIGDWAGEDAKADLNDPRLRNLTRGYSHVRANRKLTVSLTVGPAGLTAQHTPEYCYPGSGFQLVGQPQNLMIPGRSDVFRTAVYRKQIGGASESLRIIWAWTNDGHWAAPTYPELTFLGRAPLFKLYVVSDVLDGEPSDDALLNSFLADLVNNLRPLGS